MNLKQILQKQGELYKNLTSNKIIEECHETIKPELVRYKNYWILKQEYKIIREFEKQLKEEPAIVGNPTTLGTFQISIQNNKITYLRIRLQNMEKIPEQIKDLQSLQILELSWNKIKEIKNLDNLTNLKELWLYGNEIKEIKNLDNLTNLQKLDLGDNQITEIKNLNKLTDLKRLWLQNNQIKSEVEIKKLRKKGIEVRI